MIEVSLKKHLKESAALSGVSVFNTIENDAKNDYVIISVVSNTKDYNVQLEDQGRRARVQFDCYSSDQETVKTIAKALEQLLHGNAYSNAYADVTMCYAESQTPFYDPEAKLYRESCDYIINYYEV